MLTLGIYAIPDPDGGAPCDVHDHNLVLMNDGQVVEFLELERLSRRKHDNELGQHLEEIIRDYVSALPEQFRIVYVDSFAGRKVTTRRGLIHLEAADCPELSNSPQPALGYYTGRRPQLWVCNHELAHIGTHLAFSGGFEDNSLLVHIDGGASKSNCSVWLYRDNRIEYLHHSWELHPHVMNFSDNPLSLAVLGLPKGSDLTVAGKLMGYASFGIASQELKEWLRAHGWFRHCGPDMSEFHEAAARDFGWRKTGFDTGDQFLMNVAACIQEDLEEAIESFIHRFQRQTGAEHLYYSGGAALNIKVNSRIENSGCFKSVHIPPCCNDTGLALGAASILDYLGGAEVKRHGPFLNSLGLQRYTYSPRFCISDVASRIASGQVIGVCVGNAEVGPRALGHRSIIANPCSLELRDRVSIDIKHREWYRPVAPMILKKDAEKIFEQVSSSSLARYMLGNYKVRPEMRDRIPGVVHVDGSARVQVIDECDPELRLIVDILTVLRDEHGIPCVINTSFNRRDEPIVHTHEDAFATAWAMGLDAVIVDNDLFLNPGLENRN